jgi:hypothetical protein
MIQRAGDEREPQADRLLPGLDDLERLRRAGAGEHAAIDLTARVEFSSGEVSFSHGKDD